MTEGLSDSRFHMWRTLFAMTHVDHRISKEEVRFMAEALEDVPFSQDQRNLLHTDMLEMQDIEQMFKGITDPEDQAEFFNFARKIVWADGNYGDHEKEILLKLQKIHLQMVRVDDLVDKVKLEFAEEQSFAEPTIWKTRKKKGLKGILQSFRDQFSTDRGTQGKD